MRIIRLQTQGFKRVSVVDVTPGDGLVEVRGNNAEGKSSLLDSIMAALGGADAAPVKPIKTGEDYAAIRVTLGDGQPDLIVTKYFDEVGEKLRVETADGAEFKAGQTKLDDLLGRMTFDPLAFARMPAKDQAAELRRLVPLEVDLDELARLDKADADARRDVNRDGKALKARLDAIPVETDLPETKPDLDALTATLANAAETNGAIERDRASREQREAANAQRARNVAATREEIERLTREADAEEAAFHAEVKALAALPALAEPVDTTAARAALDDARAILDRFSRKESRDTLAAELEALRAKSEGYTASLTTRAGVRAKALASAKMPVEGLAFARLCDIAPTEESEELIVAYNGEPFSQSSGAEQLRVSMLLAMQANPKLRVMLIKDGSLLDPNGLALVRDMAKAGDYQVWLEGVGEGDGQGIIMEAGKVRGAPDAEPVAPPKRRKAKEEAAADGESLGAASDPEHGATVETSHDEAARQPESKPKPERPRAMREFSTPTPTPAPQGGLFGDDEQ